MQFIHNNYVCVGASDPNKSVTQELGLLKGINAVVSEILIYTLWHALLLHSSVAKSDYKKNTGILLKHVLIAKSDVTGCIQRKIKKLASLII